MTEPPHPKLSYAIVTPSFRGDFERCELLCESMQCFAPPDATHYLIVDRRDKQMFSSLASGRTHILIAEEILGFWCRRIPRTRRWWLTQYGFPVRNWILQQVVKLAVAETLQCDFYMFIDSDVCLVNYLDLSRFVVDGKVALFRVPAVIPSHDIWHRNAGRMLGAGKELRADRGYIGNLITWRYDNLQSLYSRIRTACGTAWRFQIARRLHFSEYTLYGRFIDDIVKGDAGHFHDSTRRCHEMWQNEAGGGLESFFSRYDPAWPSIMISSKAGFEVREYRRFIDVLWRSSAAAKRSVSSASAHAAVGLPNSGL